MRRLALACLLLVACVDPPERVSHERGQSPEPSVATATAIAEIALPEPLPPMPSPALTPASEGFVLDEPGAEPRAPLRFTPRAGTSRRAALTMAMRVRLSGAMPMAQDLAPVERTLTTELGEAGDGRTQLRLGYAPAASEQGEGLAQTLTLDADGRVQAGELEGDGADPKLRRTLETLARTLEQLLVVLPPANQAVGTGASWRFDVPVTSGGLELDQTTRVELVARDGDRATFAVQLSQRPRSATFTAPGQTSELELVEFLGQGAAWIVYDLAAMQPLALVAKLETKFSAATQTEPVRQIDFDLLVELQLQPR